MTTNTNTYDWEAAVEAVMAPARAAHDQAFRKAGKLPKFLPGGLHRNPARGDAYEAADAVYAAACAEARKLDPMCAEFRALHPDFHRTGKL